MENKDVRRSKTGFLSLKNEADARDSTEASLEKTQGGTIKNNPTSEHRALPTVPTKHHSKQSALASPTSSPSMASGSKTGVNAEDTKDFKKNNAPLSVADSSGASGDCHIGLKLGKRTYFEDKNGGGAVRPPSQVAVSPSQSKKSRAMAQATQTPRCQVEGCNKDLTSSKDYHRRHKVCEVHSKTAKVSVAGKEQRFCQQCSRFHELIEFDEGKRSCRRRLAGHNERRRKPQPDPTTINAARHPPSFYDIRHGNYLEKSLFLHPSISSSSLLGDPCDFKLGHGQRAYPRFIKTEDQSTYNGNLQAQSIDQDSYSSSDRLLLFLQNSKTVSGNALNQGYPQYILSSGSPLGQALTLSSSQGTGVTTPPLQNLSGVSDSGRALSLLSPPSWAPRTSLSVSLNMATRSGSSLDQLVHNQPPMAQPLVEGFQHNYDFIEDKLLSISPQSTTGIVSGGFPLSGGTSINKEQHGEVTTNTGDIGNFGSQMPGLQQQPGIIRDSQGLSPKDIRCTIELLRKSSGGQAHESQAVRKMGNPGSGQLSEFDPVKSSYETSMYYSQQMM